MIVTLYTIICGISTINTNGLLLNVYQLIQQLNTIFRRNVLLSIASERFDLDNL